MKISKIITAILILVVAVSCNQVEDRLYSFEEVTAPSDVTAIASISADNTGKVVFMPSSEGATAYLVTFGDTVDEKPEEFGIKEEISHFYTEGSYTYGITAVGITGLTSEKFVGDITISFIPPSNLSVTAESDPSVSRQINISATADNATSIEYYFGEVAGDDPTIADPGETVSHIYAEAGDYDITVVAKNAAIITVDTTLTVTAIEITGPQEAAITPSGRLESDVISVFSGAYTDLANTDFNPNWGQSTIVTTVDIDGNTTLKYANLNYQGTQFESAIDASGMDYIHVDMWTDNATSVNFSLISSGPVETAYALPITSGEWVSYDIPLSEYSGVVDLADIIQFKFDGTAGSTIYLDNIYFYREGASTAVELPLDFESTTVDYTWTDFDGGNVTIIDNPQSGGINTSSKVAQMIKNAGQSWGGSYITLDAPIDFSVNKTFKMKVFVPNAGDKVLLKVENGTNGAIAFEKEVASTVGNAWEELTFDYSAIDGQDYQKIVIIFELGTMGDGSADFTYLFDDILLTN
jgi:hypothetical protein